MSLTKYIYVCAYVCAYAIECSKAKSSRLLKMAMLHICSLSLSLSVSPALLLSALLYASGVRVFGDHPELIPILFLSFNPPPNAGGPMQNPRRKMRATARRLPPR